MQAIYMVYSSHLPERANATYEISVVSYTYAAKGEHNVEIIKKPKGLNHKIIIRRNM